MNYSNTTLRVRRGLVPRPEGKTMLCRETDRRGTHLRVRKVATVLRRAARISAALLVLASGSAHAATASFATPAFDKWMYANVDGTTGGQVTAAPTFAFLGTAEDEDRLGSFLLSFNTAALIPAGLGASSYAITSVKLTLTVLTGDTFLYDPTHDTFQTYLPGGNPSAQADSDTGRPVEVFGVGLRNGFTSLSGGATGSTIYGETSPFGTIGAPAFRNAFPLGLGTGGTLFDVADNITQEAEAIPFGVGTAALSPGASVPEATTFTFQLQLGSAAILSYLQGGVNSGVLGLYVSSLHSATAQGGSQTYPRFLTEEGAAFLSAPEWAPQLEITYSVVPEPSAITHVLLGVALFAAGRAFRRRHYFS